MGADPLGETWGGTGAAASPALQGAGRIPPPLTSWCADGTIAGSTTADGGGDSDVHGREGVLRDEGEVLKKCRHQSIVQLHDILEFGDRVGLNMARAGEQTLGQRLRHEGKLHVDLLQRLAVWPRCEGKAAALRAMRLVDDTGRLIRAPEVRFSSDEIDLEAFGYRSRHN